MAEDPVDGDLIALHSGVVMLVHGAFACLGACPVHRPSAHPMVTFPLVPATGPPRRWDRRCPCGVDHPDPDDLTLLRRLLGDARYGAGVFDVHACCARRCCS